MAVLGLLQVPAVPLALLETRNAAALRNMRRDLRARAERCALLLERMPAARLPETSDGRVSERPNLVAVDVDLDDCVAGSLRPPSLVIEFELERKPRALNARDLSEAELRRLVFWILSHDGGRMLLDEWLENHLAKRRRGIAA